MESLHDDGSRARPRRNGLTDFNPTPPSLPCSLPGDRGFLLSIKACCLCVKSEGRHLHGGQFALDATNDLKQWTPFKKNTVTDGFFDIIDSQAVSIPARFYRGRYVP